MESMEWDRREVARQFGVPCAGAPAAYRLALQEDPCSYCAAANPGRQGRIVAIGEIDHIVARSKGGANHWTNYSTACGFCNACKSDRTMLEWLLELRNLREFGFPPYGHHLTFGTRVTEEPKTTMVYRRLPNDLKLAEDVEWRTR